MNIFQTSLAMAASLALAVTGLMAPANAAGTSTATTNSVSPNAQTTLPDGGEILLAQAGVPANCRRVNTRTSPLNVRSSPNGRIIRTLPNNTVVSVQNLGNWVQISSPVQGFVSANFLSLCTQPAPPSQTNTVTDNCRRVARAGGTRVRQTASTNSPIRGALTQGQRVTIINRGANGWVPVSAPINGFVYAETLGICR